MTDVRVEISWIIEQLHRHQLPQGTMDRWRDEEEQKEEEEEEEGTNHILSVLMPTNTTGDQNRLFFNFRFPQLAQTYSKTEWNQEWGCVFEVW